MNPNKILWLGLSIIALAYPLIVYKSISKLGVGLLSLILLAVFVLRAGASYLISKEKELRWQAVFPIGIVGGLCLFSALTTSEIGLRLYPVAMSVAVAALFYFSLYSERTLVEVTASIFDKSEFKAHQKQYMRGLTAAWVIVLLVNAAIASYTAFYSSLSSWALYNGLISYIAIGTFAILELGFRFIYKKRYQSKQL